jgi:hypothetical protein
LLGDLMGGGAAAPAPAPGAGARLSANPAANVPKVVVCTAQQGQGVQISAALVTKVPGQITLEMVSPALAPLCRRTAVTPSAAFAQDFTNQSSGPVQNFAIQLNKNSFGLVPSNATISLPAPLAPNQSASFVVPMTVTPAMLSQGDPNLNLQVWRARERTRSCPG